MGAIEKPVEVPPPSLEETYAVPQNQTLEQDQSIQIDERKKLFTLIDDFIQSPSSDQRTIIMELFPAFADKNFTIKTLDSDYNSALNKLNQVMVAKIREHYQLLFFFMEKTTGETLAQTKIVLARGFEFAPFTMIDLLSSKDQDQLCLLAKEVAYELDTEERKNIFTSRFNTLNTVRELAKKESRLSTMLEACLSTLRLEISQNTNNSNPSLATPTQDNP